MTFVRSLLACFDRSRQGEKPLPKKQIYVLRFFIHFFPSNAVKGTVQRDFSTPVFFTKRLVLVSIDMPKSNFEFCRIFVELFVLKISKYRLPAVTDSGESKIQP
jgi:hypothetical protein